MKTYQKKNSKNNSDQALTVAGVLIPILGLGVLASDGIYTTGASLIGIVFNIIVLKRTDKWSFVGLFISLGALLLSLYLLLIALAYMK